ncbi:MAG: 16S rRNA (cytidine(1402)-2'-O)-methyltransferase [Cyanobacteriota bacterium]|nr:16S rRNA (cytidine(1402)-2'-O)-methyltransferase [Cyanobacteriota bacterium]
MQENAAGSSSGSLYIVGTPIGNLEDITFRAVRVLQEVDAIAAEDTRHTGKLLKHFQIATPQIAYHDRNRSQRIPQLIDRLLTGESLALVTDAGMPGISDPGYELVKACAAAGIATVPIPGASAGITALSASGIASDRFFFEGFLPTKPKTRSSRLEVLQSQTCTLILYEAPHRLRQTLADLAEKLGRDRPLTIARELTKLYEEFWRGTLEEAIAYYTQKAPQGEFTLVVAGATETLPTLSQTAIVEELKTLMNQGISRSQASRQLAHQTAHSRRELYEIALAIEM